MTGMKAPTGVLGASIVATHTKVPAAAVLGAHVAAKTLPFTGAALGIYLAFALLLIGTGVALRTVGRSRA